MTGASQGIKLINPDQVGAQLSSPFPKLPVIRGQNRQDFRMLRAVVFQICTDRIISPMVPLPAGIDNLHVFRRIIFRIFRSVEIKAHAAFRSTPCVFSCGVLKPMLILVGASAVFSRDVFCWGNAL